MSSNQLLIKFALRYPWLIIATVILGFSGAIFNGIGTTLIVPLLLGFLGQDVLNLQGGPPIIRKFFSLFSDAPGNQGLILMVAVVFMAIVLKNVAAYLNTMVANALSKKLVNSIRKDGINLLLEVDLDFFSKIKIGDIMNRISQEINRTANAIKIAISLFTTAITIVVFLSILISISWELTIVSTVLMLIVAVTNQLFVRRARDYGKLLSEKSKGYSTTLLEIMTGMRLIKTVSNEDAEYKRIERFIDEREKAEYQSQANFAIIAPINEITGILAIVAIVFVGATLLQDNLIQDTITSEPERQKALSTLLLIYLYALSRMLPIIGQLNGRRSQFANVSPSAEIVTKFLSRDDKPFMTNGESKYQRIKEKITVENLHFSYPGHQDSVLNGVNLSIPKGTTLALVGSSGAGKSTLADLFPRFYDPVQGAIKIDGKDLKEYDIKDLRRNMGIVSQDTFLFNNSVRHNIAYGLPNATEEQIIQATKRANAYEFITKLAKGFDTEIGDRGVMLSGGQRQRLAIARAILRDPDILILDEATSALDTVSERLVQQALDELCRDRTTIVIAHRLSTIQKAHQIAVMEKGRVVEIGTHQELLSNTYGHYSRLYSLQFDDSPKQTLPDNPALLKTSLFISRELRHRLSYEVRSSLTSMIGSLSLLNDQMVDNPDEEQEMIHQSYQSALRLLNTIELYETTTNKP